MTTPQLTGGEWQVRGQAPFDGSILCPLYSLMYYDGNDIKPAASLADQGTSDLNLSYFARNFAGIALDSRLATDTDAETKFPFSPHQIAVFDCASTTFEFGDLISAVENSGGDGLENLTVAKTQNPAMAIGRVMKRYATATTRVEVELIGAHYRALTSINTQKGLVNPAAVALAETLAADKTIDLNEPRVLSLDPGGAGRDVDFPAEALCAGDSWFINNTADAAEALTLKNDADGTIGTVGQNECGIAFCDGTNWFFLQGANA